jgi:hypothetical protein
MGGWRSVILFIHRQAATLPLLPPINEGKPTMAASDPSERSSSAGTLTDDVIAEVIADWKNPDVLSGAKDCKVTFPCTRDKDSGKLLRSNRAYDVLEVARATFNPGKGKVLGSRTKMT